MNEFKKKKNLRVEILLGKYVLQTLDFQIFSPIFFLFMCKRVFLHREDKKNLIYT